jgi:hypothetical protein
MTASARPGPAAFNDYLGRATFFVTLASSAKRLRIFATCRKVVTTIIWSQRVSGCRTQHEARTAPRRWGHRRGALLQRTLGTIVRRTGKRGEAIMSAILFWGVGFAALTWLALEIAEWGED